MGEIYGFPVSLTEHFLQDSNVVYGVCVDIFWNSPLSVKDFKAPEYNLFFTVFRIMPSKVAIANGTGGGGKDIALSILIAASYCCNFAARRPRMSH